MAKKELDNYVFHTMPRFFVSGTVNSGTSGVTDSGEYNLTITGENGRYEFHMYLLLCSKAGAGKSGSVLLKLLRHFEIGDLNYFEGPVNLTGKFTGCGSDAMFMTMCCQVATDNGDLQGTEYAKVCDIGNKDATYTRSTGETIQTGYPSNLAGNKPASEVVVTEKYDIKPIVDSAGLENDGGGYFGRYFTAVSFVLQDAITYNAGTIAISSKSRSVDATNNTFKIKPKYTKNATNGASAYYAAYSKTAVYSKSKIYVFIYMPVEEDTILFTEYAKETANNTEVTITIPLAYIPANSTCKVAVRVEETFPDGSVEILSKYGSFSAITVNTGALDITTATRVGDGTEIQANAKYTPDSVKPALKWWGTDDENSSSTSTNLNKILLRLYDGTTQVGTDKLVAYGGGDTNASWTGLSKTKAYNVIASIAEQLSDKNKLITKGATVAGYAASGSIAITDYGRTGTSLTVSARYTGSGTTFWYGRKKTTGKTNARLNKVLLIVAPAGTSYTDATMYQAVDNGGSHTFTVNQYTTYDVYATCVESIGGTNVELKKDGPKTIPGDTKPLDPTIITEMSGAITGTTITLTPKFEFGDIKEIQWTAKLGRVLKSGKSTPSSSDSVKFELLANATTYTIIFHGLYSGMVNTDEGRTDADGNPIAVETDATLISFANSDISYDCLTYGVSVTQYFLDRNAFEGRLFQIIGAHGETYHTLAECGEHGYTGYCRPRDGSSVGPTNVGTVNVIGNAIYVTGLQPSTSYRVYVKLTNCKDFNGELDAVNYIDITTEAKAVAGTFTARVTGTSVTITPNFVRWNNSDSIAWRATVHSNSPTGPVAGITYQVSDRTSMPPAVVAGLNTGTKYYITFEAYDDADNAIPVDNIEIVTYGLKLELGTPYTRMINGNIMTYTEGERASSTVQDSSRGSAVKYYVVDESGNKVIDDTIVNCRRSNPNTFDTYPNRALAPSTTYTMYAYIEGVLYEGQPDTLISKTFTTKYVASQFSATTDATGETIMVRPTWVASNSPNNEVLTSIALYARGVLVDVKETTVSGTELWFTGLERGLEHTIVLLAEDNEDNYMANYLEYADDFSGVLTETTYKLTFSDISKSTRSIKWTCTCNRPLPPGRVIEYEVTENEVIRMDWTGVMTSGSSRTYTQLKHKTPFRVRCRIQEMRDQNGDWDTTEEFFDMTKELTVELEDYIPHVLMIETKWQAFADGLEYDKDPISGIEVAFSAPDITIVPARSGKGKTGSNYGTYYDKRVRYFSGLTGGREYIITICVTDGISKVTSTVNLWSLLQLIRIYNIVEQRWILALPYVLTSKVDGELKFWPAPLYVYARNSWRNTNPERTEIHF